MGKGKNDMVKLFSYIALVAAALFYFLTWLFNQLGGNLGVVSTYIALVRDVCVLVGIGFSAWNYTKGNSMAVKIVFWLALTVYVVFAILTVAL